MKIESSAATVLEQLQKPQTVGEKGGEIPENKSANAAGRDEYVPSEKDKPIGLYDICRDENGNPEIRFDDPEKSVEPDETGKPKSEKSRSEECTCNTDKVDRELKRLKEKAERLEQRIRNTADAEKTEELRRQLESLQSEIAQKDNDSYRRSRAEFS
ncbi:MAG: hypothetical protein NC395_05450 [Prevotella sp.]|nr:hypothetical protein [Prevotella sp.]